MSHPVIVPLINPNEPQALLVSLFVSEGQRVAEGELLCSLETTKSTAELEAEEGGFIVGLSFRQGATVNAGDRLCYIASAPDWKPAQAESDHPGIPVEGGLPAGLRITQPALALARQYSLELDALPKDTLVTTQIVQQALSDQVQDQKPTAPVKRDPSAIVVYGGGGHGKSVIDLLRALNTYEIKGIVDDGIPPQERIMDLPVLGGQQVLSEVYRQGVARAVNAVGGIGNVTMRIRVFKILAEYGFDCPSIVHPTALIEPSAILSQGLQVFPHAYVGSEAQIGFGSIINTGAIVSHECVLGDFTNISPGAMLAGGVQVGEGVLVGMGTTVNLNVSIGEGARIGNSATVKADVPAGAVVKAGAIWPASGVK